MRLLSSTLRLLVLSAALSAAACSPVVAGGVVLPPVEPEHTSTAAATAAAPTEPPPTDTLPPPTNTATASPTLTDTPTPTSEPTATATPEATATPLVTSAPPPTPDAEAARRQVDCPILLYHYVEPWPEDADLLRQGLTVRPDDFAAQMAYLHAQGYQTVSLYDLVYALALGRALPEKPVVITFDDGYRRLAEYALPAMQPYGFTGTVFVITQLMDEGFEQYLTWDQARDLHAQGWHIEPHTKTHDQLAGRGRDFQLYQMLGSLQTVEAEIGATPRFLAYPSGQYDELSIQLAREMHLWGAVTVAHGRVHTLSSLYTLARVRVSGTMTLEQFINAVEED